MNTKLKLPKSRHGGWYSYSVEHQPESKKVVELISENFCESLATSGIEPLLSFIFRDNGEALAYILDVLVINDLVKITFPKE